MNSLMVFLALVGALSLLFSLLTLVACFLERPRRRPGHSSLQPGAHRHDWTL